MPVRAKPLNRSTVSCSASAGTPISSASSSRVLGLHDRAVLVPTARERLARVEPGEEVAVAVALVDDHPAGTCGDAGRLALVDRVHRLDVRQRLVHEPLAGGVDDDRARQVALGEAEPRAAGQRDGRAPPRVVHQVDVGAGRDPGEDARRRCWTAAPVVQSTPVGVRLVPLPHLEVLLEAAAAEDHAAAGADRRAAAPSVHDADADDAAVLDDQVAAARCRSSTGTPASIRPLRSPIASRCPCAYILPAAQAMLTNRLTQHLEHGQRAARACAARG